MSFIQLPTYRKKKKKKKFDSIQLPLVPVWICRKMPLSTSPAAFVLTCCTSSTPKSGLQVRLCLFTVPNPPVRIWVLAYVLYLI